MKSPTNRSLLIVPSLGLLVFDNFILSKLFNYPIRLAYTRFPWWLKRVKRLPAMWETQVQSLGQEDPLEKEMATHSSTLAWRTPQKEEPGRLQSKGSQRDGND